MSWKLACKIHFKSEVRLPSSNIAYNNIDVSKREHCSNLLRRFSSAVSFPASAGQRYSKLVQIETGRYQNFWVLDIDTY